MNLALYDEYQSKSAEDFSNNSQSEIYKTWAIKMNGNNNGSNNYLYPNSIPNIPNSILSYLQS